VLQALSAIALFTFELKCLGNGQKPASRIVTKLAKLLKSMTYALRKWDRDLHVSPSVDAQVALDNAGFCCSIHGEGKGNRSNPGTAHGAPDRYST